jgi:predicted nuclease of predicted toxin-antitoxin system
VKLWIDECLSPTLVAGANRRGYWATCNRDRGLLGASDKALHELVIEEEAVFVTNDEADFVVLYREVDLHTGLLVLPQVRRRKALRPLFDAALDYIEQRAKAKGETAGDWMINKRVEISSAEKATHSDLGISDPRSDQAVQDRMES